MFGNGAGVGFIMLFVWCFLFIAGIMAIFIPFWVYRIRNEAIKANEYLRLIAIELEKPPAPSCTDDDKKSPLAEKAEKMRACKAGDVSRYQPIG